MCGYSRVKVRQMVWCLQHQRLTRLTDGPHSLFPSQTWQESSQERTPGSVLLLSDFYLSGFMPDSVQVTFSAWRQPFLTGPWSLYDSLRHLALFWVHRPSESHNSSNFFAIVASAGWCFLPREGKKKWIIGAEQDPWGPGLTFQVICLPWVAAEQKYR